VSQLPAALRRPQKKHPQPFASVSQLPAALRLPQKKHAPGFLEHVSGEYGAHLCSEHRICNTVLTSALNRNTEMRYRIGVLAIYGYIHPKICILCIFKTFHQIQQVY